MLKILIIQMIETEESEIEPSSEPIKRSDRRYNIIDLDKAEPQTSKMLRPALAKLELPERCTAKYSGEFYFM